MRLGELLSVVNENTTVYVVDYATKKVISCYDGKNSISSSLNEKEIVTEYAYGNILYIEVML